MADKTKQEITRKMTKMYNILYTLRSDALELCKTHDNHADAVQLHDILVQALHALDCLSRRTEHEQQSYSDNTNK